VGKEMEIEMDVTAHSDLWFSRPGEEGSDGFCTTHN